MTNLPSTLPTHLILQPTNANLARTAKLLKEGHLVILPTETVYGIAVNLFSPQARAAARALKGPGANPQWVLHLASAEDLLTWAPNLTQIAQRLITKALPGPIAFQIKLSPEDATAARERLGDAANETISADGSITFRVPELGATQQVLADAGVPIAIIGAGKRECGAVYEIADLPDSLFPDRWRCGGGAELSDEGAGTSEMSPQDTPEPPQTRPESPPTPPKTVFHTHRDTPVSAIIDAGRTRYRTSSTVVRIDGEHFSVIRPGVIDERIIQKMADYLILFVCSGNTCRSPMAAAIATRILADKLRIQPSELPLRHVVVQSAGVHAARGMLRCREKPSRPSNPSTPTLGSPPLPRCPLLTYCSTSMCSLYNDRTLIGKKFLPPSPLPRKKRSVPQTPMETSTTPSGAGPHVYQQVAGHLADLLQQRLSELQI